MLILLSCFRIGPDDSVHEEQEQTETWDQVGINIGSFIVDIEPAGK
jgi:hypothetical protein